MSEEKEGGSVQKYGKFRIYKSQTSLSSCSYFHFFFFFFVKALEVEFTELNKCFCFNNGQFLDSTLLFFITSQEHSRSTVHAVKAQTLLS